jgi:hypothetical protein
MTTNLMIFIDLIIAIYNPFVSLSSRSHKEYIVHSVLSLALVSLTFWMNPGLSLSSTGLNSGYFIPGCIIMLIIMCTFVMIIRRLKQQGTSPELKTKVIFVNSFQFLVVCIYFFSNYVRNYLL